MLHNATLPDFPNRVTVLSRWLLRDVLKDNWEGENINRWGFVKKRSFARHIALSFYKQHVVISLKQKAKI